MTPKQQRALGEAPQRERARLRASFKAQREQANANRPPQKAPPRAKARPRPKGQNRPKGGGGGSMSFNAFNPAPMPLAFSVGRATRLQGLSRHEVNTTTGSITGQDYSVAIFNGVPGHYVGKVYDVNSSGGNFGLAANFTMEAAGFVTAPQATGTRPDTAMCSKLSVRIRNISKAVDVAGVVRVMNVAAGINVTGPELINLIHYVNDHPRTRTFGASELRISRQFDTHPVDQAKYHTFVSPGLTGAEWDDAIKDPAMSSIVMLFPTILGNHYEITLNAHYYGRYRITGPLANMASHPATASLDLLNRARDEAERLGSDGYTVGARVLKHAEKPFGEAAGAAAGAALF